MSYATSMHNNDSLRQPNESNGHSDETERRVRALGEVIEGRLESGSREAEVVNAGKPARPVKVCPLCGVDILIYATSDNPWKQHQGGRSCMKMQKRVQHTQELRAAAAALTSMIAESPRCVPGAEAMEPPVVFRGESAPLSRSRTGCNPIHRRTVSDSNIDPSLLSISGTISPLQYSPSPSPDQSLPISSSLPFPPHELYDSTTLEYETNRWPEEDTETEPASCPGVRVYWEEGSIWGTYPWSAHRVEGGRLGFYPFAVDVGPDVQDARHFWVRSQSCTRVISARGEACERCKAVPTGKRFTEQAERAHAIQPHTRHEYYTVDQMLAELAKTKADLRREQLNVSDAHFKCISQQNPMLIHV